MNIEVRFVDDEGMIAEIVQGRLVVHKPLTRQQLEEIMTVMDSIQGKPMDKNGYRLVCYSKDDDDIVVVKNGVRLDGYIDRARAESLKRGYKTPTGLLEQEFMMALSNGCSMPTLPD